MSSPNKDKTKWDDGPMSPREFVAEPFRKVLERTRAITGWQPPTLLGCSLTLNVALFSYILYPAGGFSSLQPRHPEPYDMLYATWFLVFFCLYRMLLNYHVYQPLAFWLGAPDISYARKFSQQCMNCTMHFASTLYLYYYLRQRPWYHDIGRIWDGWPEEPLDPYFILFYMAHVGYHTNSLVFHFTDEVRRDFLYMFIHHTATFSLLVISFYMNETRYGSLVLFLCDSSDVIGCLTKMANYTMHRKVAGALLLPLIASWFYTRCWLLPVWVGLTFPQPLAIEKTSLFQSIMFSTLLFSLVGLNYMWLYMLIRMLWNVAMKKGTTDLSEYPNEEAEAAVLAKHKNLTLEDAKEMLRLKRLATQANRDKSKSQ